MVPRTAYVSLYDDTLPRPWVTILDYSGSGFLHEIRGRTYSASNVSELADTTIDYRFTVDGVEGTIVSNGSRVDAAYRQYYHIIVFGNIRFVKSLKVEAKSQRTTATVSIRARVFYSVEAS